MAMGVSSSQTTPLRPFWPSCFLLYRSGSLSSSVSYSSLGFLGFSRALRRSEVFKIKRADNTSPNIILFNDLFRCQQSSLFNSHSQVEGYKFNENGRIFISNEHAWSRETLQIKNERLDKARSGVKNVRGRPAAPEDCSDHMKLHYDENDKISNILADSGGFYSNSFACSDRTSSLACRSQYGSSSVEPILREKSEPATVTCTRFHDDREVSIMPSPRIHIKGKDYLQSNSAQRNESASSSTTYDTRSPVTNGNDNAMMEKLNGLPVIDSRKLGDNAMMEKLNGLPVIDSRKMGAYETHTVKKDARSSYECNLLEEDKSYSKFIEAANVLQRNITDENISKITTYKDDPKISNVVGDGKIDVQERLNGIYDKVLVVNSISRAKEVVLMLTNQYRHLVHACDTEVGKIDVKQETPVDHGEIICFSIYSGPEADFGNGKSCIWVDILDGGGAELLLQFTPFFEDPSIKKIWHNYSFDNHVIENYGIKLSGFHADTMHMARLWDSSRRANGGYSLEALSGDEKVMSGAQLCCEKELFGKISMKTIFGKKKTKKDGSEGKIVVIAPVEELQREERKSWVCYSALDAICTLKLYESLKNQLSCMALEIDGKRKLKNSMFDFYEKYWRPFGELLVKMEMEGMLVDRGYLAEIEKLAKAEQVVAANGFRNWASRYCPDAKYMNVGSDAQVRQLLFGGAANSKDSNEFVPCERSFKVPNTEKVIMEGKKSPTKFRNITLTSIKVPLPSEIYTPTGWPSVSGDALKILAGKVSAQFDFVDAFENDEETENAEAISHKVLEDESSRRLEGVDSDYGTAFSAFRVKEEGREACHAIAALCEVCSIDSLISNFILPLQGSNICGKNGRIHCSLNINTETGRLSARKPNLQNQPALEKDRYKIRRAFISAPGNSLIVADYGQLELRILAHLSNCKSMLDAFKAGGDFHSRTAMNMYPHVREAVDQGKVLLEWDPQPGEDKPPVPLLKDAFGSERRKAKMLNFSIAYGKTPVGLARDWKVSVEEARETVDLWYRERKEVLTWQQARKKEALINGCVHTLLGRARKFPSVERATRAQKGHIERAAINTPVQGSAADVAMCAMLEISQNLRLKELGWKLLLQVHDEVILEGPSESAEAAKAIVIECMSKPFNGRNFLKVDLAVDAKCAQNWYAAK